MGKNSGDIQKDFIGNFEMTFSKKEKSWTLRGSDPRSKKHNPYEPEMVTLSGTAKDFHEAKNQAAKAIKNLK